ncbi:MAG: DUF2608 domain-containing protein [Lysobacterales bacterium]
MKIPPFRVAAWSVLLALLSACAAAPPTGTQAGTQATAKSTAPPPPLAQNLLGSTDELALVTELSLDLARKYGGEKVLVALDIDNTLLAMEQDLGSDQWYYWQKALAEEEPCSALLVDDRFAVQGAVFYASAMRPTQPDAAEQVRRMQDAGLKVIALTARGADYRLQTFRELRRNGFSLWNTAWPSQTDYVEQFTPAGFARPAHYEDGVLFVAGQDKGLALQALLERSGAEKPVLILVVDDKRANLQQVMQAFSWTTTKVHAWHYTREQPVVDAFDPAAAARQWEALRPALLQIEQLLGPDNFALPAHAVREGCDS